MATSQQDHLQVPHCCENKVRYTSMRTLWLETVELGIGSYVLACMYPCVRSFLWGLYFLETSFYESTLYEWMLFYDSMSIHIYFKYRTEGSIRCFADIYWESNELPPICLFLFKCVFMLCLTSWSQKTSPLWHCPPSTRKDQSTYLNSSHRSLFKPKSPTVICILAILYTTELI